MWLRPSVNEFVVAWNERLRGIRPGYAIVRWETVLADGAESADRSVWTRRPQDVLLFLKHAEPGAFFWGTLGEDGAFRALTLIWPKKDRRNRLEFLVSSAAMLDALKIVVRSEDKMNLLQRFGVFGRATNDDADHVEEARRMAHKVCRIRTTRALVRYVDGAQAFWALSVVFDALHEMHFVI
ncbi:MAG: hypothetical protein IMW86_04180 [Hydrogenibacillus sp.]|nr:hypothetical protein [Hydrogenibacillus sp.]